MVRICRQKLNYCVGGSIEEPTVEILAAINSAIQTFFGPSHTTIKLLEEFKEFPLGAGLTDLPSPTARAPEVGPQRPEA